MENIFGDMIKKIRTERQLSQQQLADLVFVNRCSVANWENGRRIPDLTILARISRALNVDASVFTNALDDTSEPLNVIVLDDEPILLSGALQILDEALPDATITGFTKVSEALEYAQNNRIAIAFLDIELGKSDGFEVCKKLIEITPLTNVIFLTSYPEYSLNAWSTGASSFLTKPLHIADVNDQISKLRHPVRGLS